MVEENYSEFVTSVQSLLREGNTVHALIIFSDNKNSSEVKNNSWDLIPVISEFLTTFHEKENLEVFKCCEQLINTIATSSNPEEALLQFIEEIEESVDDTKFLILLGPLQKILFRIPKNRINSLAWCLNAVQTYLCKCNIPEDVTLVGKEKLLMDSDEVVQRIIKLYSGLMPFYDGLIEKLEASSEDVQERSNVICKFLVQLLGKPLAFLDMEIFCGIKKVKALIFAENLVSKIFKTMSDPFLLLEMCYGSESNELMKPNTLGTSVLFYLLYSEEICIVKVPKVYNPLYIFQNSLYLITSLLEIDHQMCIEKGLRLMSTLLEHVKFLELSYLLLDSENHSKFSIALSKIIIYNQLESIRKSALNIYQTYINSFEIRGFYLLLYNLTITLNHSGLVGFSITQYKNQLAQEFLKREHEMSIYFKGPKLLKILRVFCSLYKNEESDLIELSHQIIATLNLLRYLVLRDRNNTTQIWDYIKLLEVIYFKPLRKGIELSRAHYELKVKELEEETASGDKDKSASTKVSIMIGGQSLLDMPKNDKLNVLHSSLTAFDMMDSLLSRVIECIETYKH
ncbi:hypothetical protein NQ314_004090 [Rhamnusium bicolor]|uniref:Glomulin n=1 Tax=Rhamnusium bicolor TaxID=1586634 RepID=A0AAV8ZLJ7_9CUCU|nr:hypothetical protein NQ314_004090 [Rhamnusium bicolor]